MVLKIPPPPPVAIQDPTLNRWFLEITSILQNTGNISPDAIAGLTAAYAQIAANTTAIATLQTTTGGQSGAISALQSQINSLVISVATINGQITSLNARAQVLNGAGVPAAGVGNNGDLFLNNTGGAGTRLYGKITGAWVAIA